MNLENELNNSNKIENDIGIVTEEKQNNFLETTLGKTVNTAVDIGLRWILPDLVEDEIINIKDGFIKEGFKEGVNTAINTAIDLGKSTMGIFTGKFDSLSQAQTAVKTGGIIDGVSSVIDNILNKTTKIGLIDKNISNLIKQGKNVTFTEQLNNIEKLGKYENNWKNYYEKKDFDGMEREYNKIKDKLKEIMPLEKTINNARTIENLHILIKNNGQDFNLTSEQLELAKMLV